VALGVWGARSAPEIEREKIMAEKDDARELVLAPNEHACILDKTNGQVFLYVGPKQDSLAPSVQPVFFNEKTKTFERCDLPKAIQRMTIAPEGWYAVLKNPARDGKHPQVGNKAPMPDLDTGRKINLPGPASFALWPGQMAKVLPGHRLRSNQYLLVRVYDQPAARANWKNATIETAEAGTAPGSTAAQQKQLAVDGEKLTMGQLIVIRGTDVSFFIPPTGIEVVADQDGKQERDAVTLERLDYCMLLDEDGNKRYVRGPDVVFPEPTEVFVTRTENGIETRKFKAIELHETSGIYVKVIADYTDEMGDICKMGDELFITGTEQKMYFPREEHAIIKYGEHEVHYATAIPAGEGRYVLDRMKGDIKLLKGPLMALPDPRTQVFARRILPQKFCQLMYPNNAEALQHNAHLLSIATAQEAALGAIAAAAPMLGAASGGAYTMDALMGAAYASSAVSNAPGDRGLGGPVAKGFTGDGFDRKGRYTEPRTVTLNTKYQGAVATDLWTGYAIKLVRGDGTSRVEIGPKRVLLEYDEVPQILKLSTGRPKNADNLYSTCFLQVKANKVSDIIDVETIDFCRMSIKVSYRNSFEGDPLKWFDVENYVKFMCDHLRSRLQAAIKRLEVETFYQRAVDHVRDIVLGKKAEGAQDRPGMRFEENGMHVYDVEVLEVKILDPAIEQLLVKGQREAINQRLELASKMRLMDFTSKSESITREIEEMKAKTKFAGLELKQLEIKKQLDHDLTQILAAVQSETEKHKQNLARETSQNELVTLELARDRAGTQQEIDLENQRAAARLTELNAEVEAVVKKAQAISPDLIAAIGTFGERALIEKLSESMAPLAILGGTSITDVVKKLLEGTKLAEFITAPKNGQAGASTKSLGA
jgi:major vault protein